MALIELASKKICLLSVSGSVAAGGLRDKSP